MTRTMITETKPRFATPDPPGTVDLAEWGAGSNVVPELLLTAFLNRNAGSLAPLSLKPDSKSSGSGSIAGTWRASTGSVVGYRVTEVLVGQNNIAVGRSKSVTGHLAISGTTVTSAAFSVPIGSIHSDQSERDAQFDGRIMDAASFPVGTFTLTKPIALSPVPAIGVIKTYTVTGNLTLHGHTRTVTFTASAERAGSSIKISGSIPVLFASWAIPNPSFGTFVTTQNHGVLEFLLDFAKAA